MNRDIGVDVGGGVDEGVGIGGGERQRWRKPVSGGRPGNPPNERDRAENFLFPATLASKIFLESSAYRFVRRLFVFRKLFALRHF